MRMNIRRADWAANVALAAVVGLFAYYYWPASARTRHGDGECSREVVWPQAMEALTRESQQWSIHAVTTDSAVEGMADALAAGDAAAYREHLRRAEAAPGTGATRRSPADLAQGARERYADKYPDHAAAADEDLTGGIERISWVDEENALSR